MTIGTRDVTALRKDFPALERMRNGKPPVYLNSTCMTLRPKSVIDAITRYYREFPTCGGGRSEGARFLHNWFLEELQEHEHGARDSIANMLNAWQAEEVVWTRNCSEAINIVARGLRLEPGDQVIGSEREHNSNLVPWLEIESELREKSGDPELEVRRWFKLNEDGSFNLENALAAINERTRVVALGHASNLDGTTIPDEDLKAVVKKAHGVGAIVVLDAAQSVPHRAIDVQDLGIDFLALSIHKMCGPSGMGALWGKYEELDKLKPLIVGGDTVADTWQDRVIYKEVPGRFEAGLQDYAGMLGTKAAVEYVTKEVGFDFIESHEHALNHHMSQRLADLENDHFWVLGPKDASLRGGVLTMCSSMGSIINAIERLADEQHNIMLRKGMFCVNAYLHDHFDRAGCAKNNLRASVYLYNTIEEVDLLCDIVEMVVNNPFDYLDDE